MMFQTGIRLVSECIKTFDRNTNLVTSRSFKTIVSEFSDDHGQLAFFCNVHMLMLSQEDRILAAAMDKADWVFADGAPIAWLQSRISGKNAKVVPGYKVVLEVCAQASESGEKVGFLGSTPDVMKHLVSNLQARFQGLTVAYQYCPPFMQGELVSTQQELQAVKAANVKWLFVGLGCPKQEKWIATYAGELNCHVLGVGAAFDWLSGLVKKPPDWMERFALAWVYRLFDNPRRMWSRYLTYNTKFMVKVFRFLLTGK